MTNYRIKNWADFQHYKDRSPSWLKLHRSLLDDYEFQSLPVASRALAPMLWLLASEHKDISSGLIDADHKKIAFRLRMKESDVTDAIKPLISAGFIEVTGDATDTLAEAVRTSIPEKEDIEKIVNIDKEETDKIARERKTKPKLVSIPDGWRPNESHRTKCTELGFDVDKLGPEFVNDRLAKGVQYADWDRGFFMWIGNADKFRVNRSGSPIGGKRTYADSIQDAAQTAGRILDEKEKIWAQDAAR